MIMRCEIFAKAVQIYQQMSELHPYRHIVHYSDVMPERWIKFLKDLADMFPVLLLDEVGERGRKSASTMQSHMNTVGADSGPMAWFRIDDDDLLSVDYLDALSPYVEEANIGRGVSFGRGLAAMHTAEGLSNFRFVHNPLGSAGLAYIGRFDSSTGQVNLPGEPGHPRTDLHFPVILDSTDVKFVWIHHLGQDTKSDATEAANNRRIEGTFAKWEKVPSPDDFVSKFPSLRRDLVRASAADRAR